MRKLTTRHLTVKIDTSHLSPLDLNDIEKWENEGGKPAEGPNDILRSLMPVQNGTIFEVKGGSFQYEDDQLLYIIEIEVTALP